MMKFSQEKVLLMHQLIAQETGGDAGVRDYGLLESALESAYQLHPDSLGDFFSDVVSIRSTLV